MFKVAAYLVFPRQNGKTFLIRRGGTTYYDGWFSLVAGHVEAGESPDIALCREAREEVGIGIDPKDLEFLCVGSRHSGDFDYTDFFFTTRTWTGTPQSCEPEKVLDPGWYQWDEVKDQTIPFVIRALEAVANGETYFAYEEAQGHKDRLP